MQGFFLDGYIFKFLLFGLIHAMQVIWYALFLAGAAVNFVLCFRAVTSKNANPYLVPVLFAAPVFFGTAPTVARCSRVTASLYDPRPEILTSGAATWR